MSDDPASKSLPSEGCSAEHLSHGVNAGGEWDAQRAGGKLHPEYVDYATVAIGLYAASSGMSRDEILRIEDAFDAGESRYRPETEMDKAYTHLPVRNGANTDLGFQLYQSGGIQAAAGS